MVTWTYGSIAMSCAAGCSFVFAFIIAGGDHHGHHPPAYPYLRMRMKPFPWGPSDCSLFDRGCVAEWKKAQNSL